MNENTGEYSQMHLNKKLWDILVKSDNRIVNTSFAKCKSIVSDFTVSSFPYQLLYVLDLFF